MASSGYGPVFGHYGRDPLTGLGLASQPTLSRFENAVSARELRAMTHVLADTVIAISYGATSRVSGPLCGCV